MTDADLVAAGSVTGPQVGDNGARWRASRTLFGRARAIDAAPHAAAPLPPGAHAPRNPLAALRRAADSAPVSHGAPEPLPSERLALLRRRGGAASRGPGAVATGARIRRLFDAATNLTTSPEMDEACAYITAHGAALRAQFATLMVEKAQEPGEDPTSPKWRGKSIQRAIDATADPQADTRLKKAVQALLNRAEPGKAVPPPDRRNPVVVRWGLRALNYMEREITTAAALKRPLDEIKLGTEFTFGDGLPGDKPAASRNLQITAPEAPRGEAPSARKTREDAFNAPRTAAQKCIEAWTAAAATTGGITGNPTIVVSDWHGKATFAKRVTYTFRNPDWSWHWTADIDQACYETQTAPTTIASLRGQGAIRQIIDQHIFGLARQVRLVNLPKPKKGSEAEPVPVGLHPDQSSRGGGGHLTFDVDTAFGDDNGRVSADLVLTTLLELQENAESLADRFRRGTDRRPLVQTTKVGGTDTEPVPHDTTNAPSLALQNFKNPGPDQSTPLEEYSELVNRLRDDVLKGNATDLVHIHGRLRDFNRTLTNPTVTDTATKEHTEHPDNISHYQAINVERLHEGAGNRRIEVRDLPAQLNTAKLSQDIDALLERLEAARATVRAAQLKRLT